MVFWFIPTATPAVFTCISDGSEHAARGGCAVEVAAIGAQGLSDLHATAGIRAN